MKHYHIGTCPLCSQGRLFLYQEKDNGDVYGHCEECEQGFRTPDDIAGRSGFLTLLSPTDAHMATIDAISKSIWMNYTLFEV